jgi:hypothetical protein
LSAQVITRAVVVVAVVVVIMWFGWDEPRGAAIKRRLPGTDLESTHPETLNSRNLQSHCGIARIRPAFSGLNRPPLKLRNFGVLGAVKPCLQRCRSARRIAVEECTRTSTCTVPKASDSGPRGPARAKVITSAEVSVAA